MKTNQRWRWLMLLVMACFFYSTGIAAEPAWYVCNIDTVGSAVQGGNRNAKGIGQVTLDDADGAFTNTVFIFNKKAEDKMLATALTAAANGFQVEVFVDLQSKKTPPVIDEINLIVIP